MKSVIYIDGYNWYYSTLKYVPEWKWINIQTFFEEVRTDDEIVAIKYFTAVVDGHLDKATDKQKRQKAFLSALSTLEKVEIIYGSYHLRDARCKAQTCNRRLSYRVAEEKKTDVNIAVTILDDVFNRRVERVVLVSCDSDLEPVVEWMATNRPEVRVNIHLPSTPEHLGAKQKQRDNRNYANFGAKVSRLTCDRRVMEKHQFPDEVDLPTGGQVNRPAEWVGNCTTK